MALSYIAKHALKFGLIIIVICAVAGCGGGGGGLSTSGSTNRSPSTVTTRSVSLNNYNSWHFESSTSLNDDSMITQLSHRDNICFTEMGRWDRVTPAKLKSLNPAIKVYRIYDLFVKNSWDSDWTSRQDTSKLQTPLLMEEIEKNDWWLRDGDGNIVGDGNNNQLVDVGKPGVKEAFLKNILERNARLDFDGFVFDYWWPSIRPFLQGLKRPEAYPTDEEWFDKAWVPFIQHVMTGLRKAGYRVIGNCAGENLSGDNRMEKQRSVIDGTVYEQWALDFDGSWLDGSIIEHRINAFNSDPLEAWASDYGVRVTDPEYGRKQMVSIALYYVAIPASQQKRSYNCYGDAKVSWNSLWDFYIGEPSEPASKKSGKYFWSRKFSQGIVLLNYEASQSVTFTLDKKYRDSDGKVLSGNVTVPAHTAMILAVDNG